VCRHGPEERLRPAGEDVPVARKDLGGQDRVDHDLGVGNELRRFGMVGTAKAKDRGWPPKLLREIGKRSDADASGHEHRALDVQTEAVPERAEHGEALARYERRERPRSRPHRVDQERELTRRRQAEAHRPREHVAGWSQHEELAGAARIHASAPHAQEHVRADRLHGHDAKRFALPHVPEGTECLPGEPGRSHRLLL
jgi:hypothetical protein